MKVLTHFNSTGRIAQVQVNQKPVSHRYAVAYGEIRIKPSVIKLLSSGRLAKGDALAAARIAGIQAAKKTAELIPLCHSLNLDWVDLQFEIKEDRIRLYAKVKAESKTGVEMEALVAISVGSLTLYDMMKSADKEMEIGPIYLLEKSGGRSGHYKRKLNNGTSK